MVVLLNWIMQVVQGNDTLDGLERHCRHIVWRVAVHPKHRFAVLYFFERA